MDCPRSDVDCDEPADACLVDARYADGMCDTDCKYEWRLVVRIRTDLLAQCLDILRSQIAPRHCRAVRHPRWSSGAFVCLQRTAPVGSLSCGSREAAPVTCVTEHKATTNILFTDLVFRCVLALARCLQLRPTPDNPATTTIHVASNHCGNTES